VPMSWTGCRKGLREEGLRRGRRFQGEGKGKKPATLPMWEKKEGERGLGKNHPTWEENCQKNQERQKNIDREDQEGRLLGRRSEKGLISA